MIKLIIEKILDLVLISSSSGSTNGGVSTEGFGFTAEQAACQMLQFIPTAHADTHSYTRGDSQ